MGFRTTVELVKGLLESEYGARPDGVLPDLTPRIEQANAMVEQLIIVDSTTESFRPHVYTNRVLLELIERNLAAHFYLVFDQPFTSTSKGGASGSFQNAARGEGLGFTKYGQQAMALDVSGSLKAIEKGSFAGVKWIGKTTAEALTYTERGNT